MAWTGLGAERSVNAFALCRIVYMRQRLKRAALKTALILVIVGLAGCSKNPYALKISSINYDQEQAPGVIQFTDPKIYKREALINERRDEIAYLKRLLEESERVEFEAQVVREIELIQSLAGSVGLKFDPGAGLEFQRARELGDVQHRIQLTRLGMQLAQLERDAEVLRDKLAVQDEPSEAASDGDGTTPALPSGSEEPDLSNLFAQVNALRTFVAGRLDAQSSPPRASTSKSSPIEKFHDREAYRDAIKNAINAESLDELHDMDGNSLFRVQLQATVLPPPDNHIDTLGLLRMEVKPPEIAEEDGELSKLYRRWLWYVMQALNRPPPNATEEPAARFEQDQLLVGLGRIGGLFEVAMLEISKASDSANKCQGWREEERDTKHCWYLRIPVLPGTADAIVELYEMTRRFPDANAIKKEFEALEEKISCSQIKFEWDENKDKDNNCQVDNPALVGFAFFRHLNEFWPIVEQSLLHVANADLGDQRLEAQLRHEVMRAISPEEWQGAESRLRRTIEKASDETCRKQLLAPQRVNVPGAFARTIRSLIETPGQPGNRVSVYDVSPTERVHRVSTAARAADAVAMAASLAGTLPQIRFSGSGNVAYTRSAVGKADALERAPLVVGFAEPGVRSATWVGTDQKDRVKIKNNPKEPRFPSFGWLLGPKVFLDPEKQALMFEHYLAPYELHADLSLPGWWPYFDLEVYSAWAPNWRSQSAAARSFAPDKPRLERTVRVPMRHNTADLYGLTQLLLESTISRPVLQPRISEVRPRKLNVCKGSITIAIEGDGIWRASEVHLGGYRVPETNIRVLPDMRGITVTLASDKLPATDKLGREIVVWTHNGKAKYGTEFVFTSDAKACSSDSPPAPPKHKPAITRVTPSSISACDSDLVFTVEGRNLGKKDDEVQAFLGTMPASSVKPQMPNDGTVVQVNANVRDRTREIGGLDKLSLVLRTEHGVAQGEITVISSNACNLVDPLRPSPLPRE